MTLFRSNSGTFQESMSKAKEVKQSSLFEDIFNIINEDKYFTKNGYTFKDVEIKDRVMDYRNKKATAYVFIKGFGCVGYAMGEK